MSEQSMRYRIRGGMADSTAAERLLKAWYWGKVPYRANDGSDYDLPVRTWELLGKPLEIAVTVSVPSDDPR